MEPETVEIVLRAAHDAWAFSNRIEISLEANPTSVEADRFRSYAALGVNRVSLGVQALNDADLQRLGRLHNAAEARRAFELARQHFDRVSFDLIYARQDQSLSDWKRELSEALDLAVDHLSLYQLTIEDGTAFGDRFARGALKGLPSDNLGADLWDVTQELCEAAGYTAYEVSNHAKPGAESEHNLIYWRGGDYVGIGPGAHGRVSIECHRYATESWKNPEKWLTEAENGVATNVKSRLHQQDVEYERLIMGLRLTEGLYVADVINVLDTHRVEEMTADGLLWRSENKIGATKTGRAVLNHLITQCVKP